MRVRLLVQLSGTRNGVNWPDRGNEIDLPEEEAREMIAQLQAIPVTSHRSAEKAVASDDGVEERAVPAAVERPVTTRTGPVPARKGSK